MDKRYSSIWVWFQIAFCFPNQRSKYKVIKTMLSSLFGSTLKSSEYGLFAGQLVVFDKKITYHRMAMVSILTWYMLEWYETEREALPESFRQECQAHKFLQLLHLQWLQYLSCQLMPPSVQNVLILCISTASHVIHSKINVKNTKLAWMTWAAPAVSSALILTTPKLLSIMSHWARACKWKCC